MHTQRDTHKITPKELMILLSKTYTKKILIDFPEKDLCIKMVIRALFVIEKKETRNNLNLQQWSKQTMPLFKNMLLKNL